MVEYFQIERQIHSGFTDDVLLVMQARSDGNEEERIVESSLGFYSFLSDLFFMPFSWTLSFKGASRPDVSFILFYL